MTRLNGEILWEYAWPDEFAKATQPLVIDTNRVFIAAGYGVGCVMLKIDRSASGWSAVALWKNRNLKPKFTNLVRQGHYVYGLDEGVLTCMNLDQGNRVWKEGRYGHGQILLVDDLLLIQAESGDVALVEISPEKPREQARFPALQGKTWNNPVLVRDLLLVRNDHEAACYRLPLNASQRLKKTGLGDYRWSSSRSLTLVSIQARPIRAEQAARRTAAPSGCSCTAIASAFRWPMSTTSFLPRVMPV